MVAIGRADGAPVLGARLGPLAFVAAVFLTACTLALSTPAGASDAPASTLPPATSGPPPDGAADAGAPPGTILAPAGADEAGRRQAEADLAVVQRSLTSAAAAERKVARRLPQLEQAVAGATANIARLTAQDRAAGEALAAARSRVRRLAVAGYVNGGDVRPVEYLLNARDPIDLARRNSLVQRATQAKADAVSAYEDAQSAASAELARALASADQLTASLAQARSEAQVLAQNTASLRAEADVHRQLLQVVTAAAPVGDSDIPRLFLDAYRRAATTQQRRNPACRLSWTALAGIGRIESNHGRYHGARLALNGDVYPRIIGIALDGTNTALVKDSDKGVLDGDTMYDHAVGPMQFIPSTWTRIAQDGNGDSKADPNNAYDAALAAATYLCRAVPSGGLDTEDALRRAVFSYNHSPTYVDVVVGWAHTFDGMASTL